MSAIPSSLPIPPAPAVPSRAGTVFRVVSGNFMEMFDFFLFGFYANALSLIHI